MSEFNVTEKRKAEHVEVCSTKDVSSRYNYWDDIQLVHLAIPEVDSADIDTEIRIFGKTLAAPIVISAMTGGYEGGLVINENLARAASDLQLGMGVGSMRSAVENPELERTYGVLKDFDIPLKIANIGAPQLVEAGNYKQAADLLSKAIDMIDADLVAVHLNYLQEAVMPEGEKRSKGLTALLRDLAVDFPILVKETGAGISPEIIQTLVKMKIKGVDVGGTGGTSFAAVEFYRAQASGNRMRARLGRTFWNWGIPAPASAAIAAMHLPTIATGGIRNGLDIAKAIVIGAHCAGMASKLLVPAIESCDSVKGELRTAMEELQAAMLLTGSDTIKKLEGHNPLVTGHTREWLEHLLGEKLS